MRRLLNVFPTAQRTIGVAFHVVVHFAQQLTLALAPRLIATRFLVVLSLKRSKAGFKKRLLPTSLCVEDRPAEFACTQSVSFVHLHISPPIADKTYQLFDTHACEDVLHERLALDVRLRMPKLKRNERRARETSYHLWRSSATKLSTRATMLDSKTVEPTYSYLLVLHNAPKVQVSRYIQLVEL